MKQKHKSRNLKQVFMLARDALTERKTRSALTIVMVLVGGGCSISSTDNSMPAGISTTLKKLDFVSEANRVILRGFYEYMLSKNHKTKRHIINLLTLLISLDKFHDGLSFTSLNRE